MRVSWFSHPGKRKVCNDDAILIGGEIIALQTRADPANLTCTAPLLCAVADGMGSMAKGDVASRAALEIFQQSQTDLQNLAGARATAQRAIRKLDEIKQKRKLQRGLGTTIAGVLLDFRRSVVFNCGDSRVYLARSGKAEQISEDHTEVAEKVAAGLLSKEEARRHARKSVMTAALVGGVGIEDAGIYWKEFDFSSGGRIALMTDGIWENIPDQDICRSLASLPGPLFMRAMFDRSFQNGARDNVTCVLIEL